jgi:hypothetical protein
MNTQLCMACCALLVLIVADVFASETIYRCTANGRTVLTDRPRHADECQSLDAPSSNTFVPEPVQQTKAKAAPTSSKLAKSSHSNSESIAAEQLKAKQRCQRIEQRLDQIADKMRSGYTLQQGEKLREQRRQLEDSRRIERCR